MSILFTSKSIGPVGMKNRFICAACEGNLANEEGMVTDKLVEKMRSMAQGGAGLIISSHMAVHPYGRTRMFQPGIYNDGLISGLKTLADVIHENGSKAVFQLGHAGLQTKKEVINHVPIGPTGKGYIMTDNDINEIIQAFARASERAAEAGAAGVQIHAAHGYLINEFLSPYYNEREDQWGVTEEGRFRFLGEIISAVKKVLPESMALMVKLNTNDYTPRPGVSPDMAGRYAERLFKLGVHAIEASCGTSLLSPWNMCKGSIPINDIIETLPDEKKERMKIYLSIMKDKCSLTEGYNAEALREIRKQNKGGTIYAAGGWRTLGTMEQAVEQGRTDFIALCRPLIREPDLVNRFMRGEAESASCTSCNRCLIAVSRDIPVQCYQKGLPAH